MRVIGFIISIALIGVSVGLCMSFQGWWAFLLVGFLMFCVTMWQPRPTPPPVRDGYEQWIEMIAELKQMENKEEMDTNFEEYLRLKSDGQLG